MVFSSAIFIFAFLPAFLAIYYLSPNRLRNLVITLGSWFFYAWWRVDFLALLILVTLWNYSMAIIIHRAEAERTRLRAMWVGVGVNLLALAYFKYFNFGVDAANQMITAMGGEPLSFAHVILPIGISFFVFQSISYLVDVWRRDVEPARSFIDLAAFKAIFPQLIAGPVLRYKDLDDQFRARTHTWEKFGEGTWRFIQGLAMKVLIADSVAPVADRAFALADPSMADAWLGALAYTAQLFFDFAGYSSMAIGLGLMMGFRFIENFNHPYASLSITEFWRRWHISLSTWLRDYLYIPLGGNRKGELKTYRNLWLTMVIGGFWHGANWTFLGWGILHGTTMAIERRFGGDKNNPRLWPRGLNWLMTMLIVIVGWVMFRAHDIGTAFDFYRAMVGANGLGLSEQFAWSLRASELAFIALAYVVVAFGIARVRGVKLPQLVPNGGWAHASVLGLLFVLTVSRLSANSFSPFLYFQF